MMKRLGIQRRWLGAFALLSLIVILGAVVVLERSVEAQRPTNRLLVGSPGTLFKDETARMMVSNVGPNRIRARMIFLNADDFTVLAASPSLEVIEPRSSSFFDFIEFEISGECRFLPVVIVQGPVTRVRTSVQAFDASGVTTFLTPVAYIDTGLIRYLMSML